MIILARELVRLANLLRDGRIVVILEGAWDSNDKVSNKKMIK